MLPDKKNACNDDTYYIWYLEGEICSFLMHIHPSLYYFSAKTKTQFAHYMMQFMCNSISFSTYQNHYSRKHITPINLNDSDLNVNHKWE